VIPIILAVSAKQDASVNNVLEGIKKQALVLGQGIGGNLIPPSALTGLTAAQTQMGILAGKTKDVFTQLNAVKASLDAAGSASYISDQTEAFEAAKKKLKDIEKESGDVIASNNLLKASFATLSDSASSNLDKIQKRTQALNNEAQRLQSLASVGQLVTAAFAGVGAVFGGAAAGALITAANFEQLQAKLVAVTGSVQVASEKFQAAQAFAAKTPFDVEGIVQATAVLEGFGLKSEQVLPVAANLAAAMGTSLSEATLAIGKAAAGSLEGFESLRSTYAITTSDLQKFGLQVDKTGSILARTPAQIEKNRNALISLINLRYGDAIERQSNTLNGALSNVGDAGAQLAAGFGSTLIPIATLAARSLGSLLSALNAIPTGFKAIIAGATVVVAGVSLALAGFVGLSTSLALVQAQLLTVSATMIQGSVAATALGTASGFLSGALTFVGTAAIRARTLLLGIAAANPILLGVAAAVGVLTIATDHYNKQQVAAGDAITTSANKFAQANTTLKRTIETLNEAGKKSGVTIDIMGKSHQQFDELNEAFKKLSAEQIVQSFSKAGESTESLKAKLKALEAGSGQAAERMKLLVEARTAFEAGGQSSDFLNAVAKLKEYGVEIDITTNQMEQLETATKSTKLEIDRLGQAKFAVAGVVQAFEAFAEPLEKAAKASSQLREFLDLSKSVGTAKSLALALTEVNSQIKSNAKVGGINTSDLDKLVAKLRDPNISQVQKNAITEQIKLVQERTALEKASVQQQLDINKNAFERKKALNDQTLQQELKFVQDQLKIVKAGSDEETSLLTKKAELQKSIAEKRASIAQKQFQNVTKAAGTEIKDAQAFEDPQALVQAIEAARARVEAWAEQNKDLLKTFPAIQAELERFRVDNGIQQKNAETALLRKNYERLGQDIQTALATAINNTQKLDAVNRGLAATNASRRLGLISEAQAQNQINQLTKQKEQIEKNITAEKNAQAAQISAQQLSNAELDLQILQARKANGEKVDREILASQKAIFQQKLAQIEQERIAAIEAASGEASAIEAINKTAQLKKDAAIKQETLSREQALDQQTQATDKALGDQEKRYQQFADRIGGRNSPLQTFEQAFGGPGSFSLGGFNLDEDLKKVTAGPVNQVNRFRNVQSQVSAEAKGPNAQAQDISRRINENEREKKRLSGDPNLGIGGGAGGGQGAGGGGQTTVSIYVDGAKMEASEPEINAAVKSVLNRVARRKRMTGK